MELTAKETANGIVDKFKKYCIYTKDFPLTDAITAIVKDEFVQDFYAHKCASVAVQYIINSNPHSNPFNTNVYPTMDFWLEVKKEIEDKYKL